LILAVRGVHASFAVAGFASAAYLAGAAASRPGHGRWVDRAGLRFPLLVASGVNALLLVTVAAAAWQNADAWVMIVLSAGVGVTLPALSASLRAMWPRLAPAHSEQAYALDTLSYELSLIASPTLVGVIAVAATPAIALVVIAALGMSGTGVVAAAGVVDDRRHAANRDHAAPRGISRAVLLLITISLFVGSAEGSMTVLAPGIASAHHDHAAAGLLLSSFSAGSLLGALAYSALSDRGTLSERLIASTAGLTVGLVLLALLGDGVAGFAVCAALVGFALSPTLTIGFVAIRHAAPPGALTEAFTWASFAAAAGAAASQALVGILITGPGAAIALWVPAGIAAAALAAAVLTGRVQTLDAPQLDNAND
jgi:MFS family permease